MVTDPSEKSRVFGLGMSRTGTTSLRSALEFLGFGPCYHVTEAILWPHLAYQWQLFTERRTPPLENILGRYPSACDVPIFYHWREIFAKWPQARFILTVRSPDSWFDSLTGSILPILEGKSVPSEPSAQFAFRMCRDIITNRILGGRLFDRTFATQQFTAHNELIMRTIPSSSLLVMNIAEGWRPLCNFLGVAIPKLPFPHQHSRAGLLERKCSHSVRSK